MKSTSLVLMVLLVFASGCTVYQISSKDTSKDFYPPKTNIGDVVYVETTTKAYEQIGLVTVTTERNQSLEDVLPKLKQEAAILGADAITDIQSDVTGHWKNIHLQKLLGNASIRTHYTAKAIVWK